MVFTDRMLLFVKEHPCFCFCLVLLLGILLRGMYYAFDYRISRDGAFYLYTARTWAECSSCKEALRDFRAMTPPLFIWLLSRSIRWGCNPEIVANVLNGTANILLIVTAWFTGRFLFNSCIGAFVSALFFAVHPSVIEFAFDPIRESLSLFFVSLVFLFMIRMWKEAYWLDWVLGGVFTACAIAFRYEPYELLFLFPLSRMLVGNTNERKKTKGWILLGGFLLAFCAVFILVHACFGLLENRIEVIKTYFFSAFRY